MMALCLFLSINSEPPEPNTNANLANCSTVIQANQEIPNAKAKTDVDLQLPCYLWFFVK